MTENHWHNYFVRKDIQDVVADIRKSGYEVDYNPDAKGLARDGKPASAFIQPNGVISDCRGWDFDKRKPADARTCLQLFSENQGLNELVASLYEANHNCAQGCAEPARR